MDAAVNRGLSYESEGANRNAPVNWLTVTERDAAAGPAGSTNYTTASALLPGGTANLLVGAGNPLPAPHEYATRPNLHLHLRGR